MILSGSHVFKSLGLVIDTTSADCSPAFGLLWIICHFLLLLLLLYIIKLIEPSAMKLINIQRDSSDSLAGTNSLAGNDALAGQIFRLT